MMETEHVYIKAVSLVRDVNSGRMEVKVDTNHGRFHVAAEPTLVEAFYDHIARVAREDIQNILEQERPPQEEHNEE